MEDANSGDYPVWPRFHPSQIINFASEHINEASILLISSVKASNSSLKLVQTSLKDF